VVYLKPLAVTRHLAYPLALRGGSRGITTRTVAGRRAGDHHTVPVIPVELNWSRFLVCPYGESDWVRSLRAAGTGELSGGGPAEAFRATEVPANEREPISTGYRQVAGSYEGSYFAQRPDPRDHPAFQIDKM
jgi:hypothetical protein